MTPEPDNLYREMLADPDVAKLLAHAQEVREEASTPEQRAARVLRGWITEAVGTGVAGVEQLEAFIADAIREAVADSQPRGQA